MKYFMDFEFLEGDIPVKIFGLNIPKWLIKPNNTIQPISIGLVSSDDREYYAISKDFNLKEAWNRNDLDPNHKRNYKQKDNYWIRDNVLRPIFDELILKYALIEEKAFQLRTTSGYNPPYKFNYNNIKNLINLFGKSNKEIADEIKMFIGTKETVENYEEVKHLLNPQFYGYYSAYDHVALYWLFGKMIDLPKGFPMYTIDLKQILDEKAESKEWYYGRDIWNNSKNRSTDLQEKDQPASLEEKIGKLKRHDDYPKQTNEHNALADAKWNKELYEFLKDIAQ